MALAPAPAVPPPPRRSDRRVVLHFDYDCFYAQVAQNRAPGGALAGKCVGVTQKSILATCNYAARRRGVRKLMRIADARRVCPDLVLVDGEDLSPFRDASKQLYRLVRDAVGPAAPVERLGLDEVFVDATAVVDANAERISISRSQDASQNAFFFQLSDGADGPRGFEVDTRAFAGCVFGDDNATPGDSHLLSSQPDESNATSHTRLRLLLGSHLAAHLRLRLEHDAGYTSSAGIATSKLLSKLAGKLNKPADQTTLMSAGWGDDGDAGDAVVRRFMDVLPVRSVPGIGLKTSRLLGDYVVAQRHERTDKHDEEEESEKNEKSEVNEEKEEHEEGQRDSRITDPSITVAVVRTCPGMSPRLLDSILGSGGANSDTTAGNVPSGPRVWDLLHGVDDAPVRGGRDLPTQISIEDTYAWGGRQGLLRPDAAAAVAAELRKLAASLLRRMRADLTDHQGDKSSSSSSSPGGAPAWLARPRTLRLTLRPQTRSVDSYDFARVSRSQPLPGFALSLSAPPAQVADRLVAGCLVPMFRRLAASVAAPPPWTVGLLNVCVANMAPVAGRGGDIAALFKRQEGDGHSRDNANDHDGRGAFDNDDNDDHDEGGGGWDAEDDDADGGGLDVCGQCGHFLPPFARAAHARYHLLGD